MLRFVAYNASSKMKPNPTQPHTEHQQMHLTLLTTMDALLPPAPLTARGATLTPARASSPRLPSLFTRLRVPAPAATAAGADAAAAEEARGLPAKAELRARPYERAADSNVDCVIPAGPPLSEADITTPGAEARRALGCWLPATLPE